MAVRYLVDKDGEQHLPYTDSSGSPDHRLMGAAWAALHGGYRGNKYEGPNKSEAIAKLKKIYEKEGMDTPSEKSAGGGAVKYLSAAIKSVYEGDDDCVFVEGCLAAEEVDDVGECMDWKTSIPHFKSWNKSFAEKTANAEGGVSVGNLRVMHQRIVAGKFVSMEYDDAAKQVLVTAKVTNPVEQKNVREGIYTAFSIGAHYVKKWFDSAIKATRWTAKPFEGSLVDFGAMPSSNGFTYRTLDGTEEAREFDNGRSALREAFEQFGKTLKVAEEKNFVSAVGKAAFAQKGLWTVSSFAQLIASLVNLRDAIEFEREQEGDLSPVTDRISDSTNDLLECLAAYTQEQVSEEINRGGKTMDVNDFATNRRAAKAATQEKTDVVEITTAEQVDVTKFDPEQLKALVAKASDALKKGKKEDKCMKAEADCDDENCDQHGAAVQKRNKEKSKAAAAGATEELAIKRADVVSIVQEQLTETLKPFGEQLDTIGKVLAAIAGQPVDTAVKARGNVVSKAQDQEAEEAEKSIRATADKGDLRGAIMQSRQRPQVVRPGDSMRQQ